MRAIASSGGRVYQAGGDQTINENQTVLPGETLRLVDQVAAPSHLVNIPAGHAQVFVGRGEELAVLGEALPSPRPGAEPTGAVVVAALHGLGGIGKSTLAARYAAAHAGVFNPVWWITADTPASIEAGLAGLATALQPELARVVPSPVLAARAAGWLACHTGWLLILDNVTDPAHIAALLDRTLTGRVLVTSRLGQGWHRFGAKVLRLEVLDPDAAIRLLSTIATGEGLNPVTDTAGTTGDPDIAVDTGAGAGLAVLDGAAELVEALGFLPLAIEQAAAYLHQNQLTPRAYLDLLATHPAVMFGQAAEGGDAGRTIARIWRITLDQLTAATPLAGELLRILAWYAPERIPRTLLDGLAEAPVLQQALGRLAAYNMITLYQEGITVHRLVQAVARTPHPDDPHRRPADVTTARQNTTTLLNQALPDVDDPARWPDWRRLLPHIDALTGHAPAALDNDDISYLMDRAGTFLRGQGALARAIGYLQRAHQADQRLHGPDHLDTMTSRNNLAYAYLAAGDLGRAIPLFEQTLADRVRVLGGDHPDTLISRSNLANAYREAGDLGRAIPLFEQTLADSVRVLGGDHPHTLAFRISLAYAYRAAGQLSRAILLFEQNLADQVRVLGGDHPHTLISRSNLAGAYRAAGELSRAILLFEQTLADQVRVLGGDHPHTLASRSNLAGAYRAAGELSRAIPLYEQTLADCVRVLGGDHPHTLTTRNNLASAYQEAGELSRAIPLHEQALADCVRVLGGDHPDTLQSRNNLAGAYQAAGDLGRAIPLHEQTLADRGRVLGGDHPDTLQSRNNLAGAYQAAGELSRAIPLFEQTLARCERVLGTDHPTTKIVRDNVLAARRQANADPI
ncbi:tetratricopeptide repeat protein [Herbidospora sp. NEAU-GS84]|uniref:Tetratricopeptide repeat protein n=2 Tax=Herbidospora solisilvae TaxID=2696284 RepID=A0A7C9JPL2_9ACTN|nr:tetratricopeptide repeat protein [Herbidospora solisilvae]